MQTSRHIDTSSTPDLVVAAAQLPLDGVRVLVVDDDEPAREVLKVVLEGEGAEVTTADSAAAALNELDQGRPDAMLVDLGMPVVDGFTLVEQVRQRTYREDAGVPVAALTGYVSAEDRERAARVGFQTYLVKPVDPAELVAAVKSLAAAKHCEPAPSRA